MSKKHPSNSKILNDTHDLMTVVDKQTERIVLTGQDSDVKSVGEG